VSGNEVRCPHCNVQQFDNPNADPALDAMASLCWKCVQPLDAPQQPGGAQHMSNNNNNNSVHENIDMPTVSFAALGRACLWEDVIEEISNPGWLGDDGLRGVCVSMRMPDAQTEIYVDSVSATRSERGKPVEEIRIQTADDVETVVRWIAAGFYVKVLQLAQQKAQEALAAEGFPNKG
jgi:hypothetical protein